MNNPTKLINFTVMNDNFFKKVAILLLFIGFGSPLFAQIQSAELGVNGLTCSQCSRSVEMKLNKLKFIEKVTMDLEHTNATIIFKKNMRFDLSAIAKAVRDAGFSVRILTIAIDNKKVDFTKKCFLINNDAFDIIGDSTLKDAIVKFQILGRDFMSSGNWHEVDMKRNPDCIGKNTYFIKQVK